MDPRNISITGYTYVLPSEFIAHYPLAERDASKLLVYRQGHITEDIYKHIANHIPEGSLLIFNNTRVVEARILFRKPTGGQIELFCLEPPAEYGGIAAAMMQKGSVRWKCLIGGASKWKPGQVLSKSCEPQAVSYEQEVPATPIILEARYLGKEEDAFLIELSWTPIELTFAELLHQAGLIPLPPYIRRPAETSDAERYQTIYARHNGSVAAPTAGLHFTDTVFGSLAEKNIQHSYVTLHVGAGTFLPVKTPTLRQHSMHIEFISVEKATIVSLHHALTEGRPIIPVGTTSARTIESLYWLGVKITQDLSIIPHDLEIHQWDAYELPAGTISPATALTALLDWMERQGTDQLTTTTQLLITPGYDWKIAHGLITNFHQPESTLLLLVASLIGKDWEKVYKYALEHSFRFLSYGDGCLLWKTPWMLTDP